MGAADDFLDGKTSAKSGADAFLDEPVAGPSIGDKIRMIDAAKVDDKEPSTFEYLFNRIKKGAAAFMGMPGDALSAIQAGAKPYGGSTRAAQERFAEVTRGQAPIIPKKVMATSEDYRKASGYDPDLTTSNTLTRYAGGVAEMAGGGGPFGLTMRAATLPALATSIVGSGIGMEAGGDVAEGIGLDRNTGEAVGALAGGVAAAITPNAGRAGFNIVKDRFSPNAAKARAESHVAREISEQLNSLAQQNLNRSLEVSDEIAKAGADFSPSLPARTNSPGLLGEERILVSRNASSLNKAFENLERNAAAIDDFMNAKFPAGKGDAAVRVSQLQKMALKRLEGMRAAVDEKLDDAVRVFQTNPGNYENGTRLRDLFFKQKEVYSGIRRQKYQEVYDAAEKLGVKANIDDVAQYVDDVLKNEMNAYQQDKIPLVFRMVRDDMAKKEPPKPGFLGWGQAPKGPEPVSTDISFEKLHSLYKRANKDLASLRGAMRDPDTDFRIMLVEGLKTKLTDKINRFEADGFGEVATKLKEANRFYAQEYLPRFKQGFGGDITARFPTGEFRTPAEHVTELITKANNTQAAKDFRLLFDETPEAWQALRNGYLDTLYRNGGVIDKDGRISQKALDRFLRQHEPTLREFPVVKQELQRLSLDNSALLNRRAELVVAEKKLAAQDLFKLFQGKEPAEVLTKATADPNVMRLLAYQARNDKGMASALNRAIAEHVTSQDAPWEFFRKNAEAIKIGLKPMGDDHFKNLTTVVDALEINARNPVAKSLNAATAMPDSVSQKFGSSPRAIISHILNVERGRSGATQEGAAFLGRLMDKMRRDHRAVAMEAVFYDKDTAAALARLAKNPESQKAQMDWARQMTALGVRTVFAGQEE